METEQSAALAPGSSPPDRRAVVRKLSPRRRGEKVRAPDNHRSAGKPHDPVSTLSRHSRRTWSSASTGGGRRRQFLRAPGDGIGDGTRDRRADIEDGTSPAPFMPSRLCCPRRSAARFKRAFAAQLAVFGGKAPTGWWRSAWGSMELFIASLCATATGEPG